MDAVLLFFCGFGSWFSCDLYSGDPGIGADVNAVLCLVLIMIVVILVVIVMMILSC